MKDFKQAFIGPMPLEAMYLGSRRIWPVEGPDLIAPRITVTISPSAGVKVGDTVTVAFAMTGVPLPAMDQVSITALVDGTPVGLAGAGASRTFAATTAGTLSIAATVTTEAGTGSGSASIVIAPAIVAPLVDSLVFTPSAATVEETITLAWVLSGGMPDTVTPTVTGPSGPVTLSGSGDSRTFVATQEGSYSGSLVVANAAGTDSRTIALTIKAPEVGEGADYYPDVAALDVMAASRSLSLPEGNNRLSNTASNVLTQKGAFRQDSHARVAVPASTERVAFWTIARLPLDKRWPQDTDNNVNNTAFGLMGNGGSSGGRYSIQMGCRSHSTAARRNRLYAHVGATAANLAYSPEVTEDGFLGVLTCDGAASWRMSWYSLRDGTKYAGDAVSFSTSATALAGGGIALGGVMQSSAFSSNGNAASPLWPGEIEAIGILRQLPAPIGDEVWSQLALGGDIAALLPVADLCYLRVWNAATGTLVKPAYATGDTSPDCYPIPGDGTSAVPASTILPGSSLRRQSLSTWLTIDGISDGWVYGLLPGETEMDVPFAGDTGGLTGAVEVQVFELETGAIVRDWTAVDTVVTSGRWAGVLRLPKARQRRWWGCRARLGSTIAIRTDAFGVGGKYLVMGQSQLGILFTLGPFNMQLTKPLSASLARWGAREPGGSSPLVKWPMMGRIGSHYAQADGITAMVETLQRLDPDMLVMIIDEAVNGTSVMDLVTGNTPNDSNSRAWSQLTDKIDRWGNDVTGVLIQWGTKDADAGGTASGYAERLDALVHGTGPQAVAGRSLDDVLRPGYHVVLSPLSRHNGSSKASFRAMQIAAARARGWSVSTPVSDMFLDNNQGPHQLASHLKGNRLLGERMGLAAAMASGITTPMQPYYGAPTYTSNAVTIPIVAPEGSTITAVTPAALSGWALNTGSGFASTGFTAALVEGSVVLTLASGTFASAPAVQYGSEGAQRAIGTGTGVNANETAIHNGMLYAAVPGYSSVTGLGMPVMGMMNGAGQWEVGFEAMALPT